MHTVLVAELPNSRECRGCLHKNADMIALLVDSNPYNFLPEDQYTKGSWIQTQGACDPFARA